jgi:sulfite oxidase
VSLSNERTGAGSLPGKHADLEVLSEAPLVLSTPIEVLGADRITDKRHLFVRNIQDYAEGQTLEPLPIEGWEVELVGLIDPARVVVQAEQLLDMDQVDYEMVLQCSGNGRSMFGDMPGTPWDQGGVANVRFTGVPLAAVLREHGVAIDRNVAFVTAEGRDHPASPEQPDFEHSLPIRDVIDTSILALQLNGEALPGIHGGPVRLVTPGYFGTMQIKWLTRLRFEATESTAFHHAVEYRVPLAPVTDDAFRFTLENSRPTWRMRLMSYILDPVPASELQAGTTQVRGVAFGDGSARIDSVLVSTDRGATWQAAHLDPSPSPYAWLRWTAHVELRPETEEIWSRAVDEFGHAQPIDGGTDWNPNGYEWSGVFRTSVVVDPSPRPDHSSVA